MGSKLCFSVAFVCLFLVAFDNGVLTKELKAGQKAFQQEEIIENGFMLDRTLTNRFAKACNDTNNDVRCERTSGNWWLYYGTSGHYTQLTAVGYWPSSSFTSLANHATHIDFAGVVYYIEGEEGPPMGSGHYADEGEGKAAQFSGIQLVDQDGNTYEYDGDVWTFDIIKPCYSVSLAKHNRYPHKEDGQIPMAFVVRQPRSNLTELEVMEFVAKQGVSQESNKSTSGQPQGQPTEGDASDSNPMDTIDTQVLKEHFEMELFS
ncbi:hypothetical protein J5N97_029409 [Dioscorea zingiberensis]|uniref:Neprosin PEP catalytic domain-containing protein n=1 Tax=Dioscorea zingiberensis TaxID=325984 RepID=A0A9D5C1L8_9LILI|nr:hypothetical protein J5N97_029409 [Dioscorea zingiberensis]